MLISAIKFLAFALLAYFVIVGMVATYLVTFSKHEEKRREP
jgi:uncharacterized membrane protein